MFTLSYQSTHLPPATFTVSNPSHGVWLDELPADVCNRIAAFVLAPVYNQHAINLSNVSEKQRVSVKSNLSNKFNLWNFNGSLISWRCGMKLLHKYAALLGSDVTEIHTPGFVLHLDHMEKCFKNLTLVKASIYDCPPLFDVLAHARNLRSLSLKFSHSDDLKSFIKRLPALDLREFSLSTISSLCLHENLSDDPNDHSTLATLFPNVERLKLICYCCGGREHPRSFLWRVAEQFHKLNDVFIAEGVPEDAIDRLQEMDRVSVKGGAVFQLLDRIPDRIAHINTYDLLPNCSNDARTLQSNHINVLANCTRLEELVGLLRPGCEHGLLNVMGCLRKLSIEFVAEEDEDGEEREVHEPDEGVFFEAIKAAPYLKVIHLNSVHIKRRELRNIFVALGDRLEEYEERFQKECGEAFEYTVESHKQEVRELIETLQTAALHNPNLRSLRLDGFFDLTDENIARSELPTYDTTIAVLARHAPFLPITPFKLLRNRYENEPDFHCCSAHASI